MAKGILDRLNEFFDPVTADPYGLQFSLKISILVQILHESIDVGDRVLVFSQSIPTLDFIEVVLSETIISRSFGVKTLNSFAFAAS